MILCSIWRVLQINFVWHTQFRSQKSSLSLSVEDDENVEEEVDEVVPDGVEEVELAKINLEKKEREQKILLEDIKKLSLWCDPSKDLHQEKESNMWMVDGGIAMLVRNESC